MQGNVQLIGLNEMRILSAYKMRISRYLQNLVRLMDALSLMCTRMLLSSEYCACIPGKRLYYAHSLLLIRS